jgi:hypothetical protein
VSATPGRAAAALGVLAVVLGLGLGGCGGSARVSDVVPHGTPELTPPEDHTAETAAAKKTRVTTIGSATSTSGESAHQEATEASGSSAEGSAGTSGSETSGTGNSSSGVGGGTAAGEKGAESSGGKSTSEGATENGGASAP